MGWNLEGRMRRGAQSFSNASLQAYGSGDPAWCGFNADTSACWYEVSYGDDSSLATVTAHYKFVPGSPQAGWPLAATGEYSVNLPTDYPPANLATYRLVGTWVASTWWGWGASGPAELYQTTPRVKFFILNGHNALSIVNESTVSSFANQTDTEWYINLRYEAA